MASEKKKNQFKIWYAVSMAWQLGFFIALPIIGFLLVGIWLDVRFEMAPFFLFLGLFLGLGTTGYEVYHLIGPLIQGKDDRDQKSSQ